MIPFKPLKALLVLGLATALLAPAVRAQDKSANASGLQAALIYEVLVGEFSLQADDPATAYQYLLDAARKSGSQALYERSVAVALRARAGDSALAAAQAWAREMPTSDLAHRYLMQILVALNKLPETIEANRRALTVRALPQRVALIDALPAYFARAADKAAAARALEQALAPELTNTATAGAAYAAIGTLRLINEDKAGALDAARKGHAQNPAAEQPLQLAIALIDPQLPDAEALVLQRLATGTPGTRPALRMAYVRQLLEAQRYDDATRQVDILTRSSPDYPEGWLMKGSLALQNNLRAEAREALLKYTALKTTSPAPAATAAATANADAAPAEASDPESSPAAGERGLAQAYYMLALIAEQQGQYAESAHYLDQITDPADALRVQSRRAALLARQGQLDAGRALIQALPADSADDARNKINAEAQLLRDNRQFQAELEVLRDGVRRFPDDMDMVYDLAMVAEKTGHADEMERLLRQVIAARPEFPHAYNALGYSLADRNVRLDEARQLINKALQFAPNDPYIVDSLGWVEFRSGNLESAERLLRDAYRNKHDAEIAAHLGEVLWSLHQQEQARAVWSEGLHLSPDNGTLQETMKRLH